MTQTAKELIENEVKSVENSISTGRQCGKTYKSGVREGLMIALAHIQNATTLVTADETVTIDKEIYDLLINKVSKQREQLATTVEALKYLVSAQEQLWTSTNGRGLVDEAMDHAKQALAEIGREDE